LTTINQGAEREIQFFVYREIPIDENNLSNETHDRGILYRTTPEDLGAVIAFVKIVFNIGDVRIEYFYLSVYPPAGWRASPGK